MADNPSKRREDAAALSVAEQLLCDVISSVAPAPGQRRARLTPGKIFTEHYQLGNLHLAVRSREARA